jgi:hypothetical protein
VGGVLCYGLAHRSTEGNPTDQQRVIVDRLVRWATRRRGQLPGRQRDQRGPERVPDPQVAGRLTWASLRTSPASPEPPLSPARIWVSSL